MANFNKAIAFTLKWEGGWNHVSGDKGGETYQGISRNNHPNWVGWKQIDAMDKVHGRIYPQLQDEVYEFYRTKYWGLIEEICNDSVAALLFDFKVNSGYHAIEKLQAIVGAKVDGVLGDNTIVKTNNHNGNLFAELLQARRNFYYDIVHRSPSQKKFLNGWLNRIDNLQATFNNR